MTTRPTRLIAAVLAFVLIAGAAAAQPRAVLWPRWLIHDERSIEAIDHAAWDRFLAAYVVPGGDGLNRFAYHRVSSMDRKALADYIARLAAVPIAKFNRAEQMAYWINLYNALTVKVVLDHYPVESILKINISPGLFVFGPWRKPLIRIDGEDITLDDIEHRILRPVWQDARIHYAVNCASIGCPNLAPRAYTGATVDAMLDEAARGYVNSRRGASFEADGLYLSKIYSWYVEDFGGSEAGVLAHLRKYAAPGLARRLADTTAIAGYRYDWDLNGTEKPR